MRTIPTEQIRQRIQLENPWWEVPHQIPDLFRSWIPRPYLGLLYPLIAQTEVHRAVILMGPRRVGKTVLLHHAIQNLLADGCSPRRICYLSVDHPLYVDCSLDRLIEIFAETVGVDHRREPCFIFFDEIQYLKSWEVHLKALVDRHPHLQLIASGSAAAALRLKSDESGAGRFTDFHLPPLTFHEYLLLRGDEDLVAYHAEPTHQQEVPTEEMTLLNERFIHYLNFGGYPEVVLSEAMQADPGRFIRSDIIDKVLLRDLPSLYGISDIQELNSLFTALAYNTAQEISLEQLSQRSTVSKPTIKKYLEYLQAAFLIRLVHRVDRTGKHFKRANFFKIYLTNPSLRAALFSPTGADDGAAGALVETAVFAQWFHAKRDLHYARWDRGEVDLVHLSLVPEQRWAVEVKWSDRPFERPELLREAVGFCAANGIDSLLATTRTRSTRRLQLGVEVNLLPAATYCLRVGYDIVKGGPRNDKRRDARQLRLPTA